MTRDEAHARRRLDELAPDAPRDVYFDALRSALAESYLSEPENPYRQSGRSSGRDRWVESRTPIVDAIHKDGDFLDVGCANGLLLESLVAWTRARGYTIRTYGIDFIAELVGHARSRLPDAPAEALEVANAFYWQPRRRFDFVRTELEYVPPADRRDFALRLYADFLAPGGRLIVCHYVDRDSVARDVAESLRSYGLPLTGRAGARGIAVAWSQRSPG